MSDFLDDVKRFVEDVTEAAAPTVEKAKEKIKDIGEKASPVIEQAFNKVTETTKEIVSRIGNADDTVKTAEPAEDTEKVPEETVISETAEAENAPEEKHGFADKASEAMNAVGKAAAPIIEKAKDVLRDVSEKAAPAVEKVKEAADSAVDGIVEGAKKATDYLYGVKEPFAPKNDLYDQLEEEAKGKIDSARAKADEMEDVLHSLLNKKEEPVEDDIDSEETGE